MKCGKCGSSNFIKAGFKQASGELKQRYYCNSCYHYFNE